jgi:flagella basal body P-ring formation protein FlgA
MRLTAAVIAAVIILASGVSAESVEQHMARYLVDKYHLDTAYASIALVRSTLTPTDLSGYTIACYPLSSGEPRGRFSMNVELSRDGAVAERGSVVMEVRCFADLPVPVRTVKRHELLAPDLFEVRRFDVTAVTDQALADLNTCAGYRARQALAAGRPISLSRIEPVPVVATGSTVTIVGVGAQFEIRTRGTALQDGQVGQTIKVKNTDSRKILSGVVTAPGTVRIAI